MKRLLLKAKNSLTCECCAARPCSTRFRDSVNFYPFYSFFKNVFSREKERGGEREKERAKLWLLWILNFEFWNSEFCQLPRLYRKLKFLEIPKIHWNTLSCYEDMKIFSFKCNYFDDIFWFFDLLYFLLTDVNM